MTETVRCISPVNGELYAERSLTPDAEVDAAIAAARSARAEWARLPVFERARYCTAAVDAMLSMRDEIVPELAWQMGRPVKFGAGELNGFEERARHMIDIADV